MPKTNDESSNFDVVRLPLSFLQSRIDIIPHRDLLEAEERWWLTEGKAVGEAIDRAGTPWLRMFDQLGNRTDEILLAPEYQAMLKRGYRAGVVWRAFRENTIIPSCLLIYIMSFAEPGVCCPYAVSLATALAIAKHGSEKLRAQFLPPLLRQDDLVWQGATWMTEIKGGSDLGRTVETVAQQTNEGWRLTGDKYFASNVGAELAVVAARPGNSPSGVRGVALFLVPRYRGNGQLNYFIRRLKDKIATRSVPTGEVELRNSEAYLLGSTDSGIYQILEVLNLSRVANSIVSVSLAQRVLSEALAFAERRVAFGKNILDHPLIHKQLEQRLIKLKGVFALAWKSVQLLEEVWTQSSPSSERYHLFRLFAHLAKYWTAEFAVDTAKWSMEVHGGLGVLAEYGAERWLREAMILSIWEGTSHRQILDGIEVMERKQAHRTLFALLNSVNASTQELREMESKVEEHLALPTPAREGDAEPLFKSLAEVTARVLAQASSKGTDNG